MDATLTEALEQLSLTAFASKLTDLGVNDASDVLALHDLDLGGIGLSTVQLRRLQRELKNTSLERENRDETTLTEALEQLSLTAFASKLKDLGVNGASDVLALHDLDLGGIGLSTVQLRRLQRELQNTNLERENRDEEQGYKTSPSMSIPTRSMVGRRASSFWRSQLKRPLRLIFIRHGESEGNVDRTLTAIVPDHMLHLTTDGRKQALDAGKRLKELIGDEPTKFVVSPYVRTRETFNGIKQAWDGKHLTMKTDVRLREQEFGNYDSPDMKKLHQEKTKYGKFYYRFPEGESPADCYDRASSFFETMYRSWEDNTATNQVIVGHGMMILTLLMRLMRFSIGEWENMDGLQNCEFVVLSHPPDDGKYSIDFTWAVDQPRNSNGLREKAAPLVQPEHLCCNHEIWDGNPDAPLLANAKGRTTLRVDNEV